MTIKNVILDFDGTLTDPWQEIITPEKSSFLETNLHNFQKKLGMEENSFHDVYTKIQGEILQDPTKGWEFFEYDVVPAMSDPYLLNNVVQKTLFERLKSGKLDEVLDYDQGVVETIDIDTFMYGNYKASYRGDVTIYREGKKETQQFIDGMLGLGLDITVVTNSEADKVRKKLETLENTEKIGVVGEAKKMAINPDYEDLPRSLTISNYPREVLLQREQYHKVIKNLEMEKGYTPRNTVVGGDLFEFDHAVPFFLGYKGVVLGSETTTPPYEQEFAQSQPGLSFVTTFDDAMKVLVGMSK